MSPLPTKDLLATFKKSFDWIAVTESRPNGEISDGFYYPTAESFQDSDIEDLAATLEDLRISY